MMSIFRRIVFVLMFLCCKGADGYPVEELMSPRIVKNNELNASYVEVTGLNGEDEKTIFFLPLSRIIAARIFPKVMRNQQGDDIDIVVAQIEIESRDVDFLFAFDTFDEAVTFTRRLLSPVKRNN